MNMRIKKPKIYRTYSPGDERRIINVTLTKIKKGIKSGEISRSWYRYIGLLGGKHERKA